MIAIAIDTPPPSSSLEDAPSSEQPPSRSPRRPIREIACLTKLVYDLLVSASEQAAGRLRHASIAAGPDRWHQCVSQHWLKSDAIVLCEQIIRILHSKRVRVGTDPVISDNEVGVDLPAGWIMESTGVSRIIELRFSTAEKTDLAEHTTFKTRLVFDRFTLRDLCSPTTRTRKWTGHITGTIAATISQGYVSYRAHRMLTVVEDVCCHAALAVAEGFHEIALTAPDKLRADMDRADSRWLRYWVEWQDPEYAATHPAAKARAARYHRLFPRCVGVFTEVLLPPVVTK